MTQRRKRRHSHKTPSRKHHARNSSLLPLFVSAGAFLGLALGLMSGQWLLMIAVCTGLGWLIGRQFDKSAKGKSKA
jgi:positive regulator of sigma E activity